MTLLKLSNAVVLPKTDSKLLYGIEPTIITPDDMTSSYAWWKLASKDSPYRWSLKQRDFKSKNLYIMYFLLSLGLLEHSISLIGGERGAGKSLYMAWFTYQLVRLFGKCATLDWAPPNPEYYGKFHDLYDEDFQNEIIEGFNRLAVLEKQTHKPASSSELENFILYNAVLGLDESDDCDRQTQSNLTQLKARILRRSRHHHICTTMVMIDIDRFAPVLKKLATHHVDCIWQGHFAGYSSILIKDIRPNGTGLQKYLWLKPGDWTHLWNSHSSSQITHDAVQLLNRPKKKKQEDN